PESDGACLRGELEARKLELSVWISSQLEPHADELRVSPTDYAELLRTLALGHVMTHTASTFTPHSLATFALHGAGKAN
ncbi:MAG TPA: hypothetical protein K8V15_04515, partial [Tessaracoccus flavescens]|nr:hypothetical protein [Tessaracoccus flavescens]